MKARADPLRTMVKEIHEVPRPPATESIGSSTASGRRHLENGFLRRDDA